MKIIFGQPPVQGPAVGDAEGTGRAGEERLDLLDLAVDGKDQVGLALDDRLDVPGHRADLDFGERKERLDRFRIAAEGVFEIAGKFFHILSRAARGDAPIAFHALTIRRDVAFGDLRLDVQLDVNGDARRGRLPAHPLDGFFEKLAIKLVADRGDVAGLLRAEDVAGAANLQIPHGDAKSRAQIAVFLNRLQSFGGHARQRTVRAEQKIAIGAVLVTTDAAAKLMEIGESEVFRAVDEHGVGAGDIEARFNDRRADQNIRLAPDESRHDVFQLVPVHLPVADEDSRLGNQRANSIGNGLDRADPVMNEIDLPVAVHLPHNRLADEGVAPGVHAGGNAAAVHRRRR